MSRSCLDRSHFRLGALNTDDISHKYVEAITPEPVPPPPPPKWKRPASEWEHDRVELAELDYGKHSLRHHSVPAYFESKQGATRSFSYYSPFSLSEMNK